MIEDEDGFEFESSGDDSEFESTKPPKKESNPGSDPTGLKIQPIRGEIVTKTKLAGLVGRSVTTIDQWIKNGMPVIARGTKREGWKIDTAAAIDWAIKYAVAQATGDPESMALETAKRRKEAAIAKIKEMELERELGRTCYIKEVADVMDAKFGEFRSRAFAIRSLIPDLTVEQENALRDAINDMLADLSSDLFWNKQTAADFAGVDEYDESESASESGSSDEDASNGS